MCRDEVLEGKYCLVSDQVKNTSFMYEGGINKERYRSRPKGKGGDVQEMGIVVSDPNLGIYVTNSRG